MKEKISCSLDGELVKQVDFILEMTPSFINSRSAIIEMALIDFMDAVLPYDKATRRFIENLFFRRCDLNAQTTSKN